MLGGSPLAVPHADERIQSSATSGASPGRGVSRLGRGPSPSMVRARSQCWAARNRLTVTCVFLVDGRGKGQGPVEDGLLHSAGANKGREL